MTNSPCYKCDKHTEDCHAKCKAYNEWWKARRDLNAKHNAIKEVDNYINGRTVEKALKRIRGKRR